MERFLAVLGIVWRRTAPISANNPAAGMSASKLRRGALKSSSGLKLTVRLLQPLFNAFESDAFIIYIY